MAVSKVLAYLRCDSLAASGYRLRITLSLLGLALGAVPIYFIAHALQPMMEPTIQGQGQQYFTFVLVGLVAHRYVVTMADALPGAIHSGIRTGTLEALFATPTSVTTLLSGMMSFRLVWTTLQALVLIAAGLALGARFEAGGVIPTVLLLVLIAASYVPFGLIAAAMVLGFRTSGPLPMLVTTGSALLGGVYYPVDVIPSWIQHVSALVPLTYGLRAVRAVLLDGRGLDAIGGDVLRLLLLLGVLLMVSVSLFHLALGHARRAGTLAQY